MTRSTVVRRCAWVLVGLAVLFWRAGFGVYPDAQFLATKLVPALPSLPHVAPLDQYLLGSPIGAIVAAIFNATTERSFELVHVVVFIGFVIGIAVLLCRKFGVRAAALVGAGFIGSQTSVILMAWIGSYDVFTVGLSSLLLLVRSRWAALVIGFLLTFAAFEQGLIILLLLGVLALLGMIEHKVNLLWAAGGLVVGRLLQQIWLSANHVTEGRSSFLQQQGVHVFLDQFWKGLPWLLPTCLGVTIVAVAVAISSEQGWRNRIVVVSLFIACFVPVAVSFDQSRIYAILTWPMVMVLLLRYSKRAEDRDVERLSMLTLGLAAIVPGIFVWTGKAQLAKHHLVRLLRDF